MRILRPSDSRLPHDQPDVLAQFGQVRIIRVLPRTNRDVARPRGAERRQKFEPHELAQPSFQSIAANGTVLVARNHDRDPRMAKRGSEHSDIEVRRPNPPPLSNDTLNLGASRQSLPARKAKAARPVRRLRTCLAV